MPTVYVRTFDFKDTLSDGEALEELKFLIEEGVPAVGNVEGVRSVKVYSGAGALRAQLRLVIEMDDAGVYERLLGDPGVRQILGRAYGDWDLKASTQTFLREVTPELLAALGGTD